MYVMKGARLHLLGSRVETWNRFGNGWLEGASPLKSNNMNPTIIAFKLSKGIASSSSELTLVLCGDFL